MTSQTRHNLNTSLKDSIASSMMTGVVDNFLNVFAIFLKASSVQIGWLSALPQFVGALTQMLSVWLGCHVSRKQLMVIGAGIQVAAIVGLVFLAAPVPWQPEFLFSGLLCCALLYQSGANLVQPHWRAMMGRIVPSGLRGRYFSKRIRLSMMTAFVTFLFGGWLLNLSSEWQFESYGFGVLFLIGMLGRYRSTRYLQQMHDPVTERPGKQSLWSSVRGMWRGFHDVQFRRFSLFLAGMNGMVALSGPFFAVYMLRELEFTYWQLTLNTATSILVQFLMLKFWGRVADRRGNRYVMALGAMIIPVLPLLWLFSDSFYYLLAVQALGGMAWSGFSLATSNYLYDLKPRESDLAGYVAVQSTLSATAICIGSVTGGYLIFWIPERIDLWLMAFDITQPILVIFFLSSLMRTLVTLWYIPSAPELRIRQRGRIRDLFLRLARFTPVSGVALDVIPRTDTAQPYK